MDPQPTQPTQPSQHGREAAPAPHPTHIGQYRILDTLGEGGMGTVYLAEQKEPMRRRVALKVIKLGMDSRAVVARFEQERQALALMQHDGIARVYDCGTSERGQPYFVMELVKGVPLNTFCEQSKLSLPQRLLLMRQVCAAVQHAHQKGVVHRDLKPGNVLVNDEASKLQVKIIDFGLAKSMGQQLSEGSLFTQVRQVLGTPEYMAPEQADPTNADIDTRADIYSLGVMLYEVLVGSLPFAGVELRTKGLEQMQRVLREEEPPKPSTKFWSTPNTSASVAGARRMSAGALQKALKNDLDWVVLKAMEKDRNRRYETANALSLDLQRFLDHEPLVAGPPSAGYRLKKLVRKYRGQVLAGGAVLVALVGGGIGTFVQYVRAEEKATEALEQKGRAEANEKIANERAEENEKLAASEMRARQDAQANAAQRDAKASEFEQLAGEVLYARALAAEAGLYPAWPSKIKPMEHWLKNDAQKLREIRTRIEETVQDLRKNAKQDPLSSEDQEADRRSDPKKFADYELLGKRVASLRHAQEIRAGKQLDVPKLTAKQQSLGGDELNGLAWDRVAPKAEDRKVYGAEPLGLAYALKALEMAKGTDGEWEVRDTLAWALFANGKDDDAKKMSAEAVAQAKDDEKRATCLDYQRDLEAAIHDASETLDATVKELAELTTEVNERRTFRFEQESQRFLYYTLAPLLTKLRSLKGKEAEVNSRLDWAKKIQELSLAHPNCRHEWPVVREAIKNNAKYAASNIDLRDEDVTGLVPIGENPETKLWEFYELRSAWDGKADPVTIPIPAHEVDGSIAVTGELGIVFVLLPGGTFLMGAQKEDQRGPNFDPQARDDESPVHEVTLAPFFLARHELTQSQWARLSYGDRSLGKPSKYKAGKDVGGKMITRANPVEQVAWTTCNKLLTQHGLVLPTEAQWEYGCRADTDTPWLCPPDELKRFANLADASAKSAGASWPLFEAWSDEHAVHSRVGLFAANAFGLYDVHGNMFEWCLDQHDGLYGSARAVDGLHAVSSSVRVVRVARGGSFLNPAAMARSVTRFTGAPELTTDFIGLRPARPLQL